MPALSAYADSEPFNEDQTLLTLYALAGEESGGFVTFRPHFLHRIGKAFFDGGAVPAPLGVVGSAEVRELSEEEMARAERELWIHYHQQKADHRNDRLFAAFAGTKLIGVARCARHPDGLEVDAVYVLDEYRRQGFARSVMALLVGECGKNDTLYMHSKLELVDFYGSLGFHPIREAELPKSIRERFSFALGNLGGLDVLPMKRDAGAVPATENT